MKKVLLIQTVIPHYRVPVFNELAKRVDLTVVYSEGELPEGIEFKTLFVPIIRKGFVFHKRSSYRIAKNFDVVICMYNLNYFFARTLCWLPHKYKFIYWGIGVSAGYNCRYDSIPKWREKNLKAVKKADAMLFYCDYPIGKYSEMGIPEEKLFVADNTVKVETAEQAEKDSILFIGTLYKQKKIDELLNNYLSAYKKNAEIPKLTIVGDGAEYENIKRWIEENKLVDKISLVGAVYDDVEISKYFAKAWVCISPDQAGLSVLKSMGNGVPYATHKDAITGGEIFNIKNGENGILFEDFNEIEKIILSCAEDKESFIQMGKKAKIHYDTKRTVSHMVDGFMDAINYSYNR